jgi:hypothetical protein
MDEEPPVVIQNTTTPGLPPRDEGPLRVEPRDTAHVFAPGVELTDEEYQELIESESRVGGPPAR